jgi:hypothetical protein
VHDGVGGEHGRAEPLERGERGGLAGGDAAGQSDKRDG